MRFSEAWNIIKRFVQAEITPLAGQDGTAEMWEALNRVEERAFFVGLREASGEDEDDEGPLTSPVRWSKDTDEILHYEMFVGYQHHRWSTVFVDARNAEEAEAKTLKQLEDAGEDDVAFVGVYHVREPEEDDAEEDDGEPEE
jgi:hypothetical protein